PNPPRRQAGDRTGLPARHARVLERLRPQGPGAVVAQAGVGRMEPAAPGRDDRRRDHGRRYRLGGERKLARRLRAGRAQVLEAPQVARAAGTCVQDGGRGDAAPALAARAAAARDGDLQAHRKGRDMTREEAGKLLAVLSAAWPSFSAPDPEA